MPDMGDLDFSKLGGGMGDMGMGGGPGGLGDEDDGDSDDDMPDLTTESAEEGKGKEPATS